ncbi:hypothetical protein CBP31_00990 [Oceanisphaera profunda]|uniref:Uncharacterized protein n=1 Tax=Oceanisphaera profunda TaxID=1416627 RepID=A0A1Y0D1I3_9GAMM|nr:hypothetical protein CBP31_00990 [Oceanisphaera profunda]
MAGVLPQSARLASSSINAAKTICKYLQLCILFINHMSQKIIVKDNKMMRQKQNQTEKRM